MLKYDICMIIYLKLYLFYYVSYCLIFRSIIVAAEVKLYEKCYIYYECDICRRVDSVFRSAAYAAAASNNNNNNNNGHCRFVWTRK